MQTGLPHVTNGINASGTASTGSPEAPLAAALHHQQQQQQQQQQGPRVGGGRSSPGAFQSPVEVRERMLQDIWLQQNMAHARTRDHSKSVANAMPTSSPAHPDMVAATSARRASAGVIGLTRDVNIANQQRQQQQAQLQQHQQQAIHQAQLKAQHQQQQHQPITSGRAHSNTVTVPSDAANAILNKSPNSNISPPRASSLTSMKPTFNTPVQSQQLQAQQLPNSTATRGTTPHSATASTTAAAALPSVNATLPRAPGRMGIGSASIDDSSIGRTWSGCLLSHKCPNSYSAFNPAVYPAAAASLATTSDFSDFASS
ncbi:hypothetical protein GQ42DRAFT_159710 [Ramicandelaber brevisporus]|nr:hypothetical protein GQ42DRAFT_159710 [Ramicandelaber brevisporus]